MSYSAVFRVDAPVSPKRVTQAATQAAKDFCHFLYGDDQRTRRTILFAYCCIASYSLALIHAGSFAACAM